MRNVLSQKFRRHQVTERNETTIVKKSDSSSNTGGESSGPKEFSRRSSMRDEINVEQCYSESSNAPRILHATQSLNDARTTPQSSMSAKYSREYPSILREQNLTKEKKSYRHSIMIPIERTNKESTEQSENFLRRQQQKLYKLRGESLRKFGQTNTPQGLDEQQRRARQHASLPPMGRQNQYPQENIPHQLPFELIIDRYPPQLVRSIDKTKQLDIWTVSDSGIYHKRHEFPQESSFGFSPFPVHGPFMAEELMLEQESKIIQRQESKVSGCYDSANQYYSGNVNGQTVGMSSSNIMSSSDELWHSAYECFPQQKKFTPQPQLQQPKIPQIQDEQKQQNNKIQTMSILAEENGSECNIQKNFHLKNILVTNLNVSGCFSERIVLFVKIPKIMASNILGPQIETSTLSEQQANEEVRLIMYKGTKPKTKLMSKSVESTGTLEGEENRRESERIVYPVRVEISGPVHFLHATNMNVMNSSDNPTDYSIQTSMTSSGGMKEFRQGTFETNFSKNRQKSPSPTKWTQTEYQPKINYNLSPEELNPVKTQFEDKRQSQVISPPVERFIESVCDIQPILAEISEAMCHQALPYEKKYEESSLRKENKNEGPPPIPPKKHLIKRQQKYIYKIEEKNKKNLKEYFNSEDINQQNPYLIQSTSHCHLARVTEITQEWLVKCNNKLKNNNNKYEDNEGVNFCNIIIKPLYGQEFDKAEFWTIEWKENIQEKSNKDKDKRIFDNTSEGIYLRDDGINKKEGNFNNYRGKFSTLQTSNHQFRQPGFQEKIYKTRSFNNDELPRLIEQTQYEELRRALLDVQRDLDSAQEYKKNNAEVERIENVILSISERIKLPNEPVTKAQAEAKEELLRVRLARMILNLDPDFEPKQNFKENLKRDNVDLSNENVFADIALEGYYVRALREPIGLLREKLALLEHRLLSEQQLEINDQLIRIDLTPPPLQNLEQKRRKESLSQRSDEISRMTPLIVMLRHKLNALDDLCHKEQLKANSTNISGRLTPYEERKTVFDLLVRINEEIDTIHKLCREENVKERIEIVLKVLKV
uniref:Uncharacterized protein n=1 Tax=Meloidogyne incognita TaxID=6306 RepID=A0A914MXZ9_MELIC